MPAQIPFSRYCHFLLTQSFILHLIGHRPHVFPQNLRTFFKAYRHNSDSILLRLAKPSQYPTDREVIPWVQHGAETSAALIERLWLGHWGAVRPHLVRIYPSPAPCWPVLIAVFNVHTRHSSTQSVPFYVPE